MSTSELKIDLINQISGITDKVRLKDILQLLKFQLDETVYITNSEEKKAITEARNQIAENKVVPNETLQEEIQKWLEK
ncbi:MAG: hypothetical protein ACK5NB_04985 [Flavobacteriaceae bacterium]